MHVVGQHFGSLQRPKCSELSIGTDADRLWRTVRLHNFFIAACIICHYLLLSQIWRTTTSQWPSPTEAFPSDSQQRIRHQAADITHQTQSYDSTWSWGWALGEASAIHWTPVAPTRLQNCLLQNTSHQDQKMMNRVGAWRSRCRADIIRTRKCVSDHSDSDICDVTWRQTPEVRMQLPEW